MKSGQYYIHKKMLNFDELNRLNNVKMLLDHEELKKYVESIIDKPEDDILEDIMDLLFLGYLIGFSDTQEELQLNDKKSQSDVEKSVFKVINGKTYVDRIKEYLEPINKKNELLETSEIFVTATIPAILKVLETELQRDYNQGSIDAAKGENINKTWITRRDDRVRDTHSYLHGITIPKEEKFYTFDGDSALIPGDFENAENNVNCRCILTFSYNTGGRETT